MGLLALMSICVLYVMALQTIAQEITSMVPKHQAFRGCDVDRVSPDSPITSLTVFSHIDCARSCLRTKTCLAFNICGYQENWLKCYLLASVRPSRCAGLENTSGCYYMEKPGISGNPCQNGGTWNSPDCTCVDGYAGQYCERYIRSCQEGWDLDVRVRKYYMVQPFGSAVAYRLYCNLQHSNNVYFFVRKRNPSCARLNFNKTWKEYKEGWGDVACGEYFVGLETMHQLMKYERFRMFLWGRLNNASKTVIKYFYTYFTVQSEDESYRMDYRRGFNRVDHRVDDGLGTERPRDFCTRDRDCGSCAMNSGGGWWYSSGCGGHAMTSSLTDFLWPVDGTDEEMHAVYLQLTHMFYI